MKKPPNEIEMSFSPLQVVDFLKNIYLKEAAQNP